MIRPELADVPGSPKAVRLAYNGWALQRAVMSHPAYEVAALRLSPIDSGRDFMRRVLINGGTDRDILWLVSADVMSDGDRSIWDAVISEYAEQDWEERE